MRRVLLAVLVLSAAACGGSDSDAPRRTAGVFEYDRGAPLRLDDRGIVNPGEPIPIHDVSFASPRGGRVPGYLLVPPSERPRPAVIYAHGAGGDREQLLRNARWMAARGAVALTLSGAHERIARRPLGGLAGLRRERNIEAQVVVDLRRAVDVLESLPEVDDERIAFVGWSAGARAGAVLAGVEPRIDAFVLMSGGALPVSEYAAAAPASLRPAVTRVLRSVDPLRYVRRAPAGSVFFQNGRRDSVIPRVALRTLVRAARAPKVRWYDAGHALDDRAYRDQLAWLSRRLGLRGPVVPGAASGP